MLYNYFKTAWRALLKGGLPNLVNISGVVIGVSAAFLVGVLVLHELSYDRHFPNNQRIYRITSLYEGDELSHHSATTRGAFAAILRSQISGIDYVTRLMPKDEVFLFTGKSAFKENIVYVDSTFLDVFRLNLLQGSALECLQDPSSLIISESTAIKLFGVHWRDLGILDRMLA